MPTEPLQYENLKAVLPYMDSNKRFQISLRMPSISALENQIPLKIENLKFSTINLEVNKFTYRLGVYRDYGRNEIPFDVHSINQTGGSSVDIDQYGFTTNPRAGVLLPGDVDLRKGLPRPARLDTVGMEQNIVNRLRIYKMILAERLNQSNIEDDDTRIAVGPWNASLETLIRRTMLNKSVEDIRSMIQYERVKLTPFNNRRYHRPLPYTAWIQLTITSTTGVTSQSVLYNKSLYEAEKVLHTKLFGNRESPINVKNLNFDLDNQILRFPTETKLIIENLTTNHYWTAPHFEGLKRIIDTSSWPIQQLKLGSSLRFPDFRHSIVKEAKSLIITNLTFDDGSWSPILMKLTNRKVVLENENRRNPPNTYLDLIKDLLERRRPVGTVFSMGIKREDTAKHCLNALKQREDVIGSSEHNVQLRIDASLTLNISYEQIDQTRGLFGEDKSKWWLKLRIIRARS